MGGGGGGKGGGGGGGGGMSAAEFQSRMAERDAEWQAEVAKRDGQWAERVAGERQNVLNEQAQAAYQKKRNKPAGKLDSSGTGLPSTVLTSAQGLGDDAPDLSRTSLLGG